MIAGLPYDAEVEWLLTSAKTCINTGITAYKNTDADRSLVYDFELTPIGYVNNNIWYHGNNGWGFWGISSGTWTMPNISGTLVENGVMCRIRVEISSQRTRLYENGDLMGTASGRDGNDGLYYLYINAIGNYGGGYSAFGGTWRLGKCSIEKGSILVRDFIPVRVGSGANAVGYMYDRVTRKLFGNAGTGAFVLGPDVATPVMGLRNYPEPEDA